MNHVRVQFNTRTYGVKSSLEELRRRYRTNPGFKRLLHAAAYAQLKRGERVTLEASNPKALRALELAVCGVRRTMTISTLGEPTREVYLMREGKAWREVSHERALAELRRIGLDAITVMKVTVYDPAISSEDAAAMHAKHAPEAVEILPEVAPFSEDRSRAADRPTRTRHDEHKLEMRELTPWDEDAATYNDAGELETPEERRERLAKLGPRQERRETFEDAWRPLPLKKTAPERPPKTVKPLPAAPWYYALEYKMAAEDQATLSAERRAYQQRRALLDDDENERLEFYDMDAELSPDDLEEGMLEPWEALENFAAAQ